MLSPTDNRVLYTLRDGPATVAAIARSCFTVVGKARCSGIRPAAAHLARMAAKGLVTRNGSLYRATKTDPPATLFAQHD